MSIELSPVTLDHVELYVTKLAHATDELVSRFGFRIVGRTPADSATHRSVALRQGGVLLVLTQGLDDDHPATCYVLAHGDGVGNIALRAPDVRLVHDTAVARGARSLGAPRVGDGPSAHTVAVIEGFGDLRHVLIESDGVAADTGHLPPGLEPVTPEGPDDGVGLEGLDHFAVCVPGGDLRATVAFYEEALGFRKIFEERITVGAQAMDSMVVQNPAGDVTFTIIEPDTSLDPGQIDMFLKNHGGAGVQHVAFSSNNVVNSVRRLRDNGVEFLFTPDSYYRLLPQRIELVGHSVAELGELKVLADEDHAGQLYQIFTRSTHPRKTLFMEVIERLGARTFGSGNIKALYEAVELERLGTESQK